MKSTLILAGIAILSALTISSCRNVKTQNVVGPTDADIDAMESILADSVLTIIDEYALKYKENYGNTLDVLLSEKEKMVRPDYLLNLDKLNTAITREQKINALGMLAVDNAVRKAYGIPTDDLQEICARFLVDVNHPVVSDAIDVFENITPGEGISMVYDICKENNEVEYFWQLENAVIKSVQYVISQDPDLYFSKISQASWNSFMNRVDLTRQVALEISKYDSDFKDIETILSDEEFNRLRNLDYAKSYYKANTPQFIKKYDDLL